MELHIIQRQILQKLIQGKHRFSELQPVDIENNLFQYHLNRLLGAKLIIKTEQGYQLAPAGYQLAAQWSADLLSVRPQPVVVVMLLIRNDKNEILVLKRRKEPFLGNLAPPFGKVHFGESLAEAATRDLFEKTGLKDIHIESTGVAELRTNGMHTIAHIFSGKAEKSEKGQYVLIRDLLGHENCMPGLEGLKELHLSIE